MLLLSGIATASRSSWFKNSSTMRAAGVRPRGLRSCSRGLRIRAAAAAASTAADIAIRQVARVARVGEIQRELRDGVLVLRLRQPLRPLGHRDHLLGEPDPVRLADRGEPSVLAPQAGLQQQRRCVGTNRTRTGKSGSDYRVFLHGRREVGGG